MGIIYKLIVGDFFYIGKTINSFNVRYSAHKSSCCIKKDKTEYNTKKYIKLRELGVNKENWREKVKYKIIYECNNDLLYCYENLCINLNNPYSLNIYKCNVDKIEKIKVKNWGTRTEKDIKEQKRRLSKKWRNENKEYVYEYNKKYNETTSEEYNEKIQIYQKIYNEEHKEERKKYKEEHKEERKKHNKKYNETHKEERKQQYENSKIYKCFICDSNKMIKNKYNRHCKTKKHKMYEKCYEVD